MSKYIKETVVKDYVWDLLNDCGHGGLTPEDIDEQSTRCVEYMLLEKDCVEIVRCKDCKYSRVYALDSNEEPQRWCKVGLAKAVDDDDYCSWGE